MMSSTSTNVNANVNSMYTDVVKVNLFPTNDYPEMIMNWREWSLKDIVRILKDIAKPGKSYGKKALQEASIFRQS